MRAGPLSNAKVISLLNRYFVPVYAVNEDYRPGGSQPAAEKAEYRRIYLEALKARLSTGTVHVYILNPDGHPIDSLHVATASQLDRLLDLLNRTVTGLKVPAGEPLVKPARQSHAPRAEAGTLVLHVVSRYLRRRGKDLVPLGKEAHLGEARPGGWAALPSENWVVWGKKDIARLLPADTLRPGRSWDVDRAAAGKLLTHFYPQTENNDVATNRIERQELKATVLSVKDGVARVRLDGRLRMKHTFYHREDDNVVRAGLVGVMDVDAVGKKVRSLWLVTDQATYRNMPFGVAVQSMP